jgi:hypothetical protein
MTIQRPMFPPPSRAEEPRMRPASRRSVLAAAPAVAAAVLAVGGIASTVAVGMARTKIADPIFAAIEAHKTLRAEVGRLTDVLDEAERNARKQHGRRPFALIKWRGLIMIGPAEIDRARLEFLRPPSRAIGKWINREHQDAKARYVAAVRAGEAWDERTGIAPLREQFKNAKAAERVAAEHLAITKPSTPAGAGALVAYVSADIKTGASTDWHFVALHTVGEALTKFAGARA